MLTKNKGRIQVFHLMYMCVCICICPQLILFVFQMYYMIRRGGDPQSTQRRLCGLVLLRRASQVVCLLWLQTPEQPGAQPTRPQGLRKLTQGWTLAMANFILFQWTFVRQLLSCNSTATLEVKSGSECRVLNPGDVNKLGRHHQLWGASHIHLQWPSGTEVCEWFAFLKE